MSRRLPARPMGRLVAPSLVLLVAVGIVSAMFGESGERLDLTRTSHGVAPYAWGAAYTLLSELDLGAHRSRIRLEQRTAGRTQWIIAPQWQPQDLPDRVAHLRAYAEAGGTVVLFGVGEDVLGPLGLTAAESEGACGKDGEQATTEACKSVADTLLEDEGDIHYDEDDGEGALMFEAPMLRKSRFVVVSDSELIRGLSSDVHAVVARKEGALIVERTLGKGRAVAVASERFLTNAHLDDFGHAPLLVDLVRHYGAPTFDEHCHGLLPVGSVTAALGTTWSWLAALCWGALTLAALLYARRWPAPSAGDAAPPPPTLDVFIGSLATHYHQSGRRSPEAVFRAYRDGYLRRLQGAHPMPQARFDAQLRRQADLLAPADRPYLLGTAAPRTQAQLLRGVRALERHAERHP